MNATSIGGLNLSQVNVYSLGAPLLLMLILAMMVVPLPTILLDLLFTFNIALGLVVLLAAVYSARPLDFSAFPTVLLLATLLRLSLNVASTRVVLLNGHSGPGAAGDVIQAFGDFVVGGNYTVGFVVFAILVIINFVVVTKGAGRISEVNARFTLDAMPGKQMAVDADLNAGILSSEEARERRAEIGREADFYGAMDGASKFVRGDAVAGLLILAINIIGGLAIGAVQHGMSIGEATRVFVLLTIGDGLVAQIPSLMLATAAAIIVTRVSASGDMGRQVATELFQNPMTLAVTSGVMTVLGLIPGMPNLAFLACAAATGGAAYMNHKRSTQVVIEESVEEVPAAPAEARELSWDDVVPIDAVGLEVGYRLIPLVDKAQGGPLLNRLRGVRKKLSQELGFLLPPVHIRDNLDLAPTEYRIMVSGAMVAKVDVQPGRELAINPGQVFGEIEGLPGHDPVFDLPAVWITEAQRDNAQSLGYTVVDVSTVVATHVSQVLQNHAHQLLGHDEVQNLLDRVAQSCPKLVEDLVPKVLPLGTVVSVLKRLLKEKVPIRDTRTILEVLSQNADKSQDSVALTGAVRSALGRLIVQQINGPAAELPVMTLDSQLEQLLLRGLQASSDGAPVLEPGLANNMLEGIREVQQQQELKGEASVLLVSDALRDFLSRLCNQNVKGVSVLAYSEVPDDLHLRIIAAVGRPDAVAAGAV